MITILFFNVLKTFDNVSHERLLHNLKKKMNIYEFNKIYREFYQRKKHEITIFKLISKLKNKDENLAKLFFILYSLFIL